MDKHSVKNNEDSVWKEAVETYFCEFMEFFFPNIFKDIDFDKGYEFLDKELEKVTKDALIGKRFADILTKVYLKNGDEKWILIHIEVQGYYEKDFAKRMYIYNYRIFDRYGKDVVSLAILTDSVENFRPNKYEMSCWGFRHTFEFPVVKLLDYKNRWTELENSKNPLSVIIMAHFKETETKKDIDNRLFWKITLVKKLYEKGYSKIDILLLYKFIDWLVYLPDDLNISFHNEIIKYEEEKKMPYITTAEKIGIEKGMAQGMEKGMAQGMEKGMAQGLIEGIEFGLKLKFGIEGLKLQQDISKIKDVNKLRIIKDAIEYAESLEDIKKLI